MTITLNFLWISCSEFIHNPSNNNTCRICSKQKTQHMKPRNDNLTQKIQDIKQKWQHHNINFWYNSDDDTLPSFFEN